LKEDFSNPFFLQQKLVEVLSFVDLQKFVGFLRQRSLQPSEVDKVMKSTLLQTQFSNTSEFGFENSENNKINPFLKYFSRFPKKKWKLTHSNLSDPSRVMSYSYHPRKQHIKKNEKKEKVDKTNIKESGLELLKRFSKKEDSKISENLKKPGRPKKYYERPTLYSLLKHAKSSAEKDSTVHFDQSQLAEIEKFLMEFKKEKKKRGRHAGTKNYRRFLVLNQNRVFFCFIYNFKFIYNSIH
jgi:hypothetical protein